MNVPFNKIYYNDKEIQDIKDCLKSSNISSDGRYSELCEKFILNKINRQAILTTSCTSALEMAALLLDIKKGDEIIMPSFTFPSTANAFVLRGATPVFIDIDKKTLNIDENLIENTITEKTKAIVVVHYAGIACNMSAIKKISKKHNLYLIEDAAHAIGAKYNNQDLGSIGDIGCYSFHSTKNITSGEGGAIIINDKNLIKKAHIISDKGTNRKAFINGDVNQYTWSDIGSSYKLSDFNAALLYFQLENYNKILKKRLSIWNKYYKYFIEYEKKGIIKCPFVPEYSKHNAHIFYLLFNNKKQRNKYISHMNQNGIEVKFHYVPLHSSPAGKKFGRIASEMNNTNNTSDTLVRLPLFYDLTENQLKYIFRISKEFFQK